MSATLAPGPTEAPARGGEARPGLARLTRVELRKAVDTRAGAWLVGSIAGLTLVLVALVGIFLPEDEDLTLVNALGVAVQPAGVLLPVVGILLVASEWSQRTAMVTFTLVPRRSRVLVAKLLAGILLALGATALALLVALGATALAGSGGDARWALSAGLLGQAAFSVSVATLTGIGFGAVLLAPAPAIVASFLLPIAWAALGSLAPFEGAARWLDTTKTTAPLLEAHLSAGQWARVATSLALWLALPVAAGFWRVLRSDVS